jgi:single-stranded-DNA-specific exonuclease
LNGRPKRWHVADPAPPDYLAAFSDLSPVLAQVLYNRGYHAPNEALAFLDGRWEGATDPFQLKGMAEAVEAIWRAIRDRQPIAIYGDYDVDGVSAAVLLARALSAAGATGQVHIPDRYDEGYGVNARALRKLAAQNIKLVITVDCGISSAHEVTEAAEYGLKVIITDHHVPAAEAPSAAVAVINPRQEDCHYPYKDLAGVGLAYKLAQALLDDLPNHNLADYMDLVALGTVADVASLRGENRALVQQGLLSLRDSPRPGLLALLELARVSPQRANAWTISHVLGPRLNASGRLTHAMGSLKLLMAERLSEARPLAQVLDQLNRERQKLTLQYTEAARREVLLADECPLLFIANREFRSGLVGIVASRLVDEFYRPAVVVAVEDGQCRGSARSVPGFDMAEALNACHDLLERHGGHAAAAGFTIRTERLPELRERLQALAANALYDHDFVRPLAIDAEAQISDLTEMLAEALGRIEPCGHDNPTPLFLTRGLHVKEKRYMKDGAHLRLRLANGLGERNGVMFNYARITDHVPDHVDVVYHLEINEWKGQRQAEMRIRDLRPAQT